MERLPNEIIWKIIIYLNPNEIYKFNLVSNFLNSLRLTKTIIPIQLSKNMGIFTKKDNNEIIEYIKQSNYSFTEYLDDISHSIIKEYIIPRNYKRGFFLSKHKITYKVNIHMLKKIKKLITLKDVLKLNFDFPNEIKKYNCHFIYRLPFLIYKYIRNNNTIKALIY